MAMYLAGVPIYSIMLIERWSSTAFLKYIWKQVQKFSHGISSKPLEVQSLKHIQNSTTTNPMESIVGNLYLLLMGWILVEEASLPKDGEGDKPNKVLVQTHVLLYLRVPRGILHTSYADLSLFA
jgi:hypothetical protein